MIRTCLIVLSGMGLVAAATAHADSVDLAYRYVEAGGSMSLYLDGTHHGGGPAGILEMGTSNPVGPLASAMPATAWVTCSGELDQVTSFASTTYGVSLLADVVGQDTADMIRQLWGLRYDEAWNSSTAIFHGGAYNGYWPGEPAATAENINALSLTLATWEIKYDFDGTLASLDLNAGRFRMSASSDTVPASFANVGSWLGGLVLPSEYQGALPVLVYLSSAAQQDLIGVVPEPASVGLLALGALALGWRKR